MDSHYAAKLLRLAQKDPKRLLEEKKFWKIALFPLYLRRCDDLLWDYPEAGFKLVELAPAYAKKIAQANWTEVNAADLMILGHSYLGGAFRRLARYEEAEEQFLNASMLQDSASPKALAEYLRRYAYLLIFQGRVETFELINRAITIHKRGNLVQRHELGECLLCRGHAYFEFKQPGRSLENLTAALNHISLEQDPKPYYCALNNLTNWTVQHGSDAQVRAAMENLKPAKAILNAYRYRHFAKYSMRWLVALLEARLGKHASAELSLNRVRQGFTKLKLPYEIGLVQLDLARIYLSQGRQDDVRRLVLETSQLFRELDSEVGAEEALELWRETFTRKVTPKALHAARERFFGQKQPIPAGIAA